MAEADRLVPQESSPEAANALLKLLEEPPADSQFLLTTVDANRLLPTIRSRMVPLRLGRLFRTRDVERFLDDPGRLLRGGSPAPGGSGRGLHRPGAGPRGGPVQGPGARRPSSLRAVKGVPAARAERALKQGPWAATG